MTARAVVVDVRVSSDLDAVPLRVPGAAAFPVQPRISEVRAAEEKARAAARTERRAKGKRKKKARPGGALDVKVPPRADFWGSVSALLALSACTCAWLASVALSVVHSRCHAIGAFWRVSALSSSAND